MAQRYRSQRKVETLGPVKSLGNNVSIRTQKGASNLDCIELLGTLAKQAAFAALSDGQIIYSQGDIADSVFFIRTGRVKLSAVSPTGKEAVLSILESGCFFGEGCLIPGHPVRVASARALGRSTIVRFEKAEMLTRLHESGEFCDAFIRYMVARAGRVEADLVDQLFNSTEKRLARLLLLFANFQNDGDHHAVVPKISQETLAQMVGASRARVSSFLNKFRKAGFIEYNGGLHVHSSLLQVILRE